jgi:fatty acid desaturase
MSFTDHSDNFSALRRELWTASEPSYRDFVRSLKPDFSQVRRDVLFGYLMLLGTIVLTAALPFVGMPRILAAVIGAISVGYWIAYLQLFIHEGAHYNLAADRHASDRFCDRHISWMIGTTVASYRIVHFQHHRALGTVDDSEHTYFFPLNLWFVIKTLFGLRVLEVLFTRKAIVDNSHKAIKTKEKAAKASMAPPLVALLVHGGIIVVTYLLGFWWLSLAWIAGVGMVFPFLGALRQLLEHRDEKADNEADFRVVPHGATTRMFKEGPLGSTFGGAGFNRHLLHHWEPQISYTNLPALERFLLQTKAGPIIERRTTTYSSAFLNLLSIY